MSLRSIRMGAVVACTAFGASVALAQAWPAKPIRMIIPFTPGGSTDLLARAVGARISEGVAQTVVFDNRPGANTIIAFELQARAGADGYTLLMGGFNGMVMNPIFYPKLPYDVERDLAPIALVGESPLVLVVHPSLPVRSVKELVDHARANPEKLNYQSSGNGNITHVAAELFMSMAGIRMQHIAYKGGSAGLPDLISGQVPIKFDTPITAMPFLKTAKLRALAVTSPKRLSILPDVPTLAELGYKGYAAATWFSLVTRRGTAQDVVARLNREVRRFVESPDARAQFAAQGIELASGTPEELAALVRRDRARWTEVVRKAGIVVEPI
ncbi:MAG: tripartite tricarboxylate transporter substrate binding protein [Proteobacteria bacterium]|nr:tripartite tricarboxylate transporter substrate binding protein [Burkholderiales bacterium]